MKIRLCGRQHAPFAGHFLSAMVGLHPKQILTKKASTICKTWMESWGNIVFSIVRLSYTFLYVYSVLIQFLRIILR